jgi:hypothetical protein
LVWLHLKGFWVSRAYSRFSISPTILIFQFIYIVEN